MNRSVLFVLLVVIFVLIMYSFVYLSGRNISANLPHLEGTDIILPTEMMYFQNGDTTSCTKSPNYKLLLVFNTLDCFSCQLKLQEWKDFLKELPINHKEKIALVLIINTERQQAVINHLKSTLFNGYVFFDDSHIFHNNPLFCETSFMCMLLDNTTVVVEGNPLKSKVVRDSYIKIMSNN